MTIKQAKLSIRIDLPDGSRFGPGKAALLSEIDREGSIAGAARALEMSYPRASRLVQEMNTQFSEELVSKFQGGSARGGAALTPIGRNVLNIYLEINSKAARAADTAFQELASITKKYVD